jgi:alpha-mannosidase
MKAAALALLAAGLLAAGEQKRIYLAPDDHTDYMWTADEETYRKAFLETLDYYLDQADADPRARWNTDGAFWVWTYERDRAPAQFARLIERMRSGHITVPATALVSCYGGMPAEAALRGLYYAGELERRFGLRFPLANAMENQTQPYGLYALWAGSGVRYTWKGVCGCASRMRYRRDRPHELFWAAGPDGSRVLVKWNSFFGAGSLGGYAEARSPEKALSLADSDPRFLKLYPYAVAGIFGKGSDDLKTLSREFLDVADRMSASGRRVIVSNELDFFQDVERTYGAQLPSESSSYGNEWDIYSASMPEVSARVKRAVERLRGAEALSVLAGVERRDAARRAWMNLGLYWEHDWTADSSHVTRDARAAWHRRLAGEIEEYVAALETGSVAVLGRSIRSGRGRRFFVFNPLSWTRTDVAGLPCARPAHAVDVKGGEELPSQWAAGRLRVLARDVPPLGYRVFEIRPGAGRRFEPAARVAEGRIENDFYRLTVAGNGAITSLVEKTGAQPEFAGPALNDLGPGEGRVAVEESGPVLATLVARAVGPLRHTTRVTLVRGLRRIEIRNEIEQNFDSVQAWKFAFNLPKPEVRHEEVGAVLRARLLSQGGHYAEQNARYDWLTLNHFADMGPADMGVTLSSPDLSFMRLGASTPDALDTTMPLIAVLAGGQVDGPKLGIPKQGGDTRFLQRFALQTRGRYDAAAAMRFALEHQNPLIAGAVTGGGVYPADSFSALWSSNSNVLVWALKPHQDGAAKGLVVRVWNLSDQPQEYTLSAWRPIARAWRTNHIETDMEEASVGNGTLAAKAAPQQFQTWRLVLGE